LRLIGLGVISDFSLNNTVRFSVDRKEEVMSILFVDMEFGEIYGSFYRDFVPVEVGGVVHSPKNNSLKFVNQKFLYDGDVVLRKNLTDEFGRTIGLSETVANTKRQQYQKTFDPTYKLSSQSKKTVKQGTYYLFGQLRKYVHDIIVTHNITQLVIFGGQADLQMFKKANIDISHLSLLDIQQTITQELQQIISLEKVANIINFYTNRHSIGSRHFRYTLPSQYRHLMKPHRAIGDACRILLTYQEYHRASGEFLELSRQHITKIAAKEREQVIPLYAELAKTFPERTDATPETKCFIVRPALQSCYQNGPQHRHFAFRMKAHKMALSQKELHDPVLQQEHSVSPFKQCGGRGYYCEGIADVEAIGSRYNVPVYHASSQASEESE